MYICKFLRDYVDNFALDKADILKVGICGNLKTELTPLISVVDSKILNVKTADLPREGIG